MENSSKKNEVTLTRKEFRDKALAVIDHGDFVNKATQQDPHMGLTIMLMGIPLISDIENTIFGKEGKEDGTE